MPEEKKVLIPAGRAIKLLQLEVNILEAQVEDLKEDNRVLLKRCRDLAESGEYMEIELNKLRG